MISMTYMDIVTATVVLGWEDPAEFNQETQAKLKEMGLESQVGK